MMELTARAQVGRRPTFRETRLASSMSTAIGLATGASTAIAALPPWSCEVPDGRLRGASRCVFLGPDTMLQIRANEAFDEWPDEARQAEDLALVWGGTDETGQRWSTLVEVAAAQILVYMRGWPSEWETR